MEGQAWLAAARTAVTHLYDRTPRLLRSRRPCASQSTEPLAMPCPNVSLPCPNLLPAMPQPSSCRAPTLLRPAEADDPEVQPGGQARGHRHAGEDELPQVPSGCAAAGVVMRRCRHRAPLASNQAPLPSISDCLDAMRCCRHFSSLSLQPSTATAHPWLPTNQSINQARQSPAPDRRCWSR